MPDATKPLGLSTCACVLAKADLTVAESSGSEGEAVIRPYTPISTNAQIGSFDLLVKVCVWPRAVQLLSDWIRCDVVHELDQT